MSRCSTSPARNPRLVASRSAPAPTIPPPTIRTSNRSPASASSASLRQVGSAVNSGLGRPARRDAPQYESRPDEQDHDQQRRVEDHPLQVDGQCGGENRRSQHSPYRDRGDDEDLAPADTSGALNHDQPPSESRSEQRGPCPRAPRRAS